MTNTEGWKLFPHAVLPQLSGRNKCEIIYASLFPRYCHKNAFTADNSPEGKMILYPTHVSFFLFSDFHMWVLEKGDRGWQ